MKHALPALVAAMTLSGAQASLLKTDTRQQATADAPVYSTFHDAPTNFVFVKMPAGWAFVGRDETVDAHQVFLDEPTGFVFVKLSAGWKFMGVGDTP